MTSGNEQPQPEDAISRLGPAIAAARRARSARQAELDRIAADRMEVGDRFRRAVVKRVRTMGPNGPESRFDIDPADRALAEALGAEIGHGTRTLLSVRAPAGADALLESIARGHRPHRSGISNSRETSHILSFYGPDAKTLSQAVGGQERLLEASALGTLLPPWTKAKAIGTWQSLSIHESGAEGPIAAPWMAYDKSRLRIVFACGPETGLDEALAHFGFAKTANGYWHAIRPASALPFAAFADPWFQTTLKEVSNRWPLSLSAFDASQFAIAAGLEQAGGKGGKGGPRSQPQAAAREKLLSYDAASGTFRTRDIATAARLNLEEVAAPQPTWQARDLAHALSARDDMDDGALLEAMCRLIETPDRFEAPPAANVPPRPVDGVSYDDVQVDAARHMCSLPVSSLIDDMGLGKTYSGTAFMGSVRSIVAAEAGIPDTKAEFSGLVVCPAGQRDNWTRTILGVLENPPEVRRMEADYKRPHPGARHIGPGEDPCEPRPGGFVLVVSYETAMNDQRISNRPWDASAYDESHSAKNVKAKRTAALFPDPRNPKITDLASRFHCNMTGTETPLGVGDLFPFVARLLAARTGMSHEGRIVDTLAPPLADFKRLFASKPDDADSVTRSEARMRRLSEALDAGPRLRRLKQLAVEKRKHIVELPVTDPAAIAAGAEEQRLYKIHQTTDSYTERLKIEGSISSLRLVTAMAKVPLAAQRIAERAAREPCVVFAHHVPIVEALNAALVDLGVDVAMTHGKIMGSRERQILVDAFQAGRHQVYLSTLGASYMGYTLTRAKYMAMVELDWNHSILSQGEDRIYRRGQEFDVDVEYFVILKSFDGTIASNIVGKSRVSDIVSGDDRRHLERAALRSMGVAA